MENTMFDAHEEIVLVQKVINELSAEQKKELTSRIESYNNDRSIGKSWNEIKGALI
jgi:hypothetical protein